MDPPVASPGLHTLQFGHHYSNTLSEKKGKQLRDKRVVFFFSFGDFVIWFGFFFNARNRGRFSVGLESAGFYAHP